MVVSLTGASGAGKTTVAKAVLVRLDMARMLTSYTTRQPRESDLPGEYKYLTVEEFERMKRGGYFLWDVFVHGIYYGTTIQSLYEASQDPKTTYFMILAPDVLAALHLYVKKLNLKICSFYILAPSAEALRERLLKRGDEREAIEKRIADCKRWDEQALNSGIPYVFVRNDGDPDSTVSTITTEIIHRKSA